MQKTILLLALLFISIVSSAQISAGMPSDNQDVVVPDPAIFVEETEFFTSDSMAFDLNCDGVDDLGVLINLGYIAVDGPNVMYFKTIHPDLQICTTPDEIERPVYYSYGEELNCQDPNGWSDEDYIEISEFGGWFPNGPALLDTVYVAYQLDGQVGWLQYSYNISNHGIFELDAYLPVCGTDGVDDIDENKDVILYPNPSQDGVIWLSEDLVGAKVLVYDLSGVLLDQSFVDGGRIELPKEKGSYLLKVIDGRQVLIRRVVVGG